MRIKLLQATTGILLFFLLGGGHLHASTVKIGISKMANNYVAWLQRSDSNIILVNLFTLPIDAAVSALKECDALLLTGGEDVYPGWYGRSADTIRCTEMNRHRDSLDIALIKKALELQMPIFAICRGHQILNVALGGDLIIDIPSDFKTNIVHQCEDYLHCFHAVSVKTGTRLSAISATTTDTVTTNHHQAIGRISPRLQANAISSDGLIEGVEWASPNEPFFLLGVQWHPERMKKENGLSGKLADEFLKQARIFHRKKIKQQ